MSKIYYPTIGLEIHAELNTKSKMFCSCKNDPNETEPNKNICPICMAHPGTLPFANKQAIEYVIKVGLSIDGNIADFSEFDRKNYFYPDIPKGYQISQYKYPVVSGGKLNGVDITRIHIEEDTANSKHDRGNYSLVDYNRAGVPLMELVTEPVIHSAKEAGDFARELQLLLRTLGVAEANMEKGEMRVEANISLSNKEGELGTKVEVKNLNSFKSAERAINYELERMQALYEAGREAEIVQETRGWDENKQTTFSQRSKENANDYRYFPDPDLPKMQLHSLFDLNELKNNLPELPWQKRTRFAQKYGIKKNDIEVLINDPELCRYFESIVIEKDQEFAKIVANYLLSDFQGLKKNNSEVQLPREENFRELIEMVFEREVTSRAAKDLLALIVLSDVSPKSLAKEKGLLQENNEEALMPLIEKVILENGQMVEQYRDGKIAVIQALVGLVMKESKGSANPATTLKILKEKLG